jgi:hypothetical protein
MDPVVVPDLSSTPSANLLPVPVVQSTPDPMPSADLISAPTAPTLVPFPPDVAASADAPPAAIIEVNLSPGSSAPTGPSVPHHLVATPHISSTA